METTQNGPDSDTLATVDGVKQAPPKKHFKIRKPHRRAFIGVAGGAVFLIAMSYLFVYYPANNYVLRIGDTKYTQSEYDSLLDQAKKEGINAQAAKETIIAAEKARQASDEVNSTVSELQRNDLAQQEYYKDYSTLNDWQQLNIDEHAIPNYVQFKANGGYEAIKIGAAFNELFVLKNPGEAPDFDGFGDIEKITEYRNAATEYINNLHQSLIDNSMTAAQVLSDRQKEQKFKFYNGGSSSRYLLVDKTGSIYNSNSVEMELSGEEVEQLNALGKVGVGEIQKIELPIPDNMIAPDYDYDGLSGYSFVAISAIIDGDDTLASKYDKATSSITTEDKL